MPTNFDNPFNRFRAFWLGLGVLSLFFVAALVLSWFLSDDEEGEMYQAASAVRLDTKKKVLAEQEVALPEEKVDEVLLSFVNTLTDSAPAISETPVPKATETVEAAEEEDGETQSEESVADEKPEDELTMEEQENGTPTEDESGASEPKKPKQEEIDPAVMMAGKAQYNLCIACHGVEGEGVPNLGPPLANSEWVTGPWENLVRIQFRGLGGPITVNGVEYNFPAPMIAMGAGQSDENVAAVLTYIRNSFGNTAPPITPEMVKTLADERGKPMLTVEDLIDPFQ